MEKMKDR